MSQIKFGTDGWRGILGADFTFSNVARVVQAICDYLKAEAVGEGRGQPIAVVVGRDTRFLGEEFARTAVSVLVKNGIRALFIQEASPTPVTAHAIKTHGAAGAIMFTASHNPARYNGVKFIPEYAGPATEVITGRIVENIGAASPGAWVPFDLSLLGEDVLDDALVELINPFPAYLDQLRAVINGALLEKSGLKIIADPYYGAGRVVLPAALRAFGVEVSSVHTETDPTFGGSLPDPSEANLRPLAGRVKNEGADLGLALDGDGDRFGAVDRSGRFFTPNQILSLVAMHLLKQRGMRGSLVRSLATTHLLDKIAARFGVGAEETKVGFKHIGAKMLEGDVLLGGEESGGLSVKGHIPEKDGILADLLLAEIVAAEGKTLSAVLDDIESEFGTHHSSRVDTHCSNERKTAFFEAMASNPPASIGSLPVRRIDRTDGVKFYLEREGWVLFRPSGTEPLVRIYVEALSKEDLQQIKNYAVKLFQMDDQLEAVKE